MDIGWLHGLFVRLTFHMLDFYNWWPSIIVRLIFTILSLFTVIVAVYPLSQSFSMDIRGPDWIWGKMCDFLYVVVGRGFRLSYDIWVPLRILYDSMTWGLFVTILFLLQGMINLM